MIYGDFISFKYKKKNKPVAEDKRAFVLNPNYQGKVHALNIENLDERDIKFLKALAGNKLGEVNPLLFYLEFIKPYIYGKVDLYKTYLRESMYKVEYI